MASILSSNNLTPNYFPKQKLPLSRKGDKYFQECIDAGVQLSGWQTADTIRSKKAVMKSNYDLINNKISNE